ncbi:MAG: tRNA preQ1(34) S-adenosylmethionine ribosyltransferase-isomerase QueA [Deltaproteobacteria bacterium]|nr:tRNA preQ1(34) S-adenosylmethionine ribosyltransferase-isomerase QueA [Deltaproteobacteria bacterium]
MSPALSPKDFHYNFPDELIAKHPKDKRDESRLLALNKTTKQIAHEQFKDILSYFNKGDVLVMNNSKVFPCRLRTTRSTGGKQEILLIEAQAEAKQHDDHLEQKWLVMINASKKVKAGDEFHWKGLSITITSEEGNQREALLKFKGDLFAVLESIASLPLPPYMQRDEESDDRQRYQTVFAKNTGSVAAPTAGLHFTPEILDALKNKGVQLCEVTLHVGPGTFLPVRVDNITEHKMHHENYSLSQETADIINLAKQEARLVTAVGTTTTRVLEAAAQNTNSNPALLTAQSGSTSIFIYPPYEFKIVDRLITNFHQPESTLLMLVSALAGKDLILKAYKEAISLKYRLFSYGDAMLIF